MLLKAPLQQKRTAPNVGCPLCWSLNSMPLLALQIGVDFLCRPKPWCNGADDEAGAISGIATDKDILETLMNYHVPPAPEANSRRMPHESFFIESRAPQRPSLFHFLASLMRSNCDGGELGSCPVHHSHVDCQEVVHGL